MLNVIICVITPTAASAAPATLDSTCSQTGAHVFRRPKTMCIELVFQKCYLVNHFEVANAIILGLERNNVE